MLSKGLKVKEFPQELPEQSVKATEMVREIVRKVLNRDETFSITVSNTYQVQYAMNSTLILVPPIEVLFPLPNTTC